MVGANRHQVESDLIHSVLLDSLADLGAGEFLPAVLAFVAADDDRSALEAVEFVQLALERHVRNEVEGLTLRLVLLARLDNQKVVRPREAVVNLHG